MNGLIHPKKIKMMKKIKYLLSLILLLPLLTNAQQRISVDELIEIATGNNYQNTVNDARIKKAEFDKSAVTEFPKTGLFVENEDFSPSNPKGEWKIGIEQEIPWPGMNKARKNYMEQLISVHKMNREAIKAEITRDVKKSYYELWYLQEKKTLYHQLDSIYNDMFNAAVIRYNVGDVAGLDKIAAEAKSKEIRAQMSQLDKEIEIWQKQLMLLTNQQIYFLPEERALTRIISDELSETGVHPSLLVVMQNIEADKSLIEVQRQSNKPEFSARVFSQSYLGMKDPLSGFSVGVDFPLFGKKSIKNKISALEAEVEAGETELKWKEQNLKSQQEQSLLKLEKEEIMLAYYEESGLEQSEAIISAASLSYRSGEISFSEMSSFMIQAIDIRQNYLETLNTYNQAMIEYQYLMNHQ